MKPDILDTSMQIQPLTNYHGRKKAKYSFKPPSLCVLLWVMNVICWNWILLYHGDNYAWNNLKRFGIEADGGQNNYVCME